ncbi:hypothetical protein [Actinotalea sp. K2]|uniref:hypothetical protein n=1 Tax=Actinotalea sp. K2 TaxID=2939438 RepID=UPI002016AE81|nr:hypothetical protein [Actinotalea sp. K2]MCL3862527.1 hypothetical protein [Actinotalea sp. K2]
MDRWRRLIGHDGRLLADLRLSTPGEGGRGRAVQSGYHASWWLILGDEERCLGSGPIDLLDGRRSIKPGDSGRIAIHPMDPSAWRGIDTPSVLHLRERVGQTLGVAMVTARVDVPDEAPLRLDAVPLRPAEVRLVRRDELPAQVLHEVPRGTP